MGRGMYPRVCGMYPWLPTRVLIDTRENYDGSIYRLYLYLSSISGRDFTNVSMRNAVQHPDDTIFLCGPTAHV